MSAEMREGALRGIPALRTPAIIAAVLALLAFLWISWSPAPASAAPAECAGTFRVLHNDRIGKLNLSRGAYTITVNNPRRLTCKAASALFTRFLEDYDGILPNPWFLTVRGARFTRGKGSPVGFRVAKGTGGGGDVPGGGGKHPQTGNFCPGTFRVLHRDHIGALQLGAGPYYVILLQRNGLSCTQASHQFTRFLSDVGGVLPSPWVLTFQLGEFHRGPHGPGFRIKPVNP
jgi:hypothetical protein